MAECEWDVHKKYFNIDDVKRFDNVYDLVIYSNKNIKNHNVITKCFRGDKIRKLLGQLPEIKINMMEDEIELACCACCGYFNSVKVIPNVLYNYSICGISNTYKTYSTEDYENDKNCMKVISSFIDKLDSV